LSPAKAGGGKGRKEVAIATLVESKLKL